MYNISCHKTRLILCFYYAIVILEIISCAGGWKNGSVYRHSGAVFSEVEPTERKRLYVSLQEEVLLPAALERLYKLRYVDPQEPDREVDLFLWHFVNLLQYYGAPGLFRQKTRRAVQETLRALGLEAGNTETEEDRRQGNARSFIIRTKQGCLSERFEAFQRFV